MAYQSDIYRDPNDPSQTKLYYKPNEQSDFTYINNTQELQNLAKAGRVKVGSPYLNMPGSTPTASPPPPPTPAPPQPSLTVESTDMARSPLVSSPPAYTPPQPSYTNPTYTAPQQTPLPQMPTLRQINPGQAPTVQSTDDLLAKIQSQFKPLDQNQEQQIKQDVAAGFSSQFAEQKRVNDFRDLAARAAAAQRGDLGFGTSELGYAGLANVSQEGANALNRLSQAQTAEQNTRIQAANETNRAKQVELFNMANDMRKQQLNEYQTYVQNQMAANDADLQTYRLQLENTRFQNESARQQALDQFEQLKYENELKRQQYQDQLQAVEAERNIAKDKLNAISNLSAKEISGLGNLQDIEYSLGLPTGFMNALQQTKMKSETDKTNADISETYNKGVNLAMSLPVGQSFSLRNPDGTTTTFTGTKPNEFQILDNAHGIWRVNKDTGEVTQVRGFSTGGGGGGTGSAPTIPGIAALMQNSNNQQSPFGQIINAGLQGAGAGMSKMSGLNLPAPQNKPNVDISKFDPMVQLIINEQMKLSDLGVKDRSRLAGQLNQAAQNGLFKNNSSVSSFGREKDDKYLTSATKLADDYRNESKDFVVQRNAFQNASSINVNTSNPQDDISLVYAFMKVVDPNSVVRETEFNTAAKASSLLDQFNIKVGKVSSGQILNPKVRQDIINTMTSRYTNALKNQSKIVETYTKRAQGSRIDPEDVVTDYNDNSFSQPQNSSGGQSDFRSKYNY